MKLSKGIIRALEIYAMILSKIVGVVFMLGGAGSLSFAVFALIKGSGNGKIVACVILSMASVVSLSVGFLTFRFLGKFMINRMHVLFGQSGLEENKDGK